MNRFIGLVVFWLAVLVPVNVYKLASESGTTGILVVALTLIILLLFAGNTTPVTNASLIRFAVVIGVIAWFVARVIAVMEPAQYVETRYLVLHLQISLLLVQSLAITVWDGNTRKTPMTKKRTRLTKEETAQPAVKELADIYNLICLQKITEATKRANKVKTQFSKEKIDLALQTLLARVTVNVNSTLLQTMLRDKE